MKYKQIISDFDGTIFSHTSMTIPQNVKTAIENYRKAGGRFVLCTGRMYTAVKKYALELGLKGEILCVQGSACYNLDDDTELFSNDLPYEESLRLAKFLEEKGWIYQFYHDLRMFTEFENRYTDAYQEMTGITAVITKTKVSVLIEKESFSAHKFIVMTEPEEAEERISIIKKEFPDFDVSQSSPIYIEVVDKDSGKGNGVKKLSDYLGFSLDETAVFGDETNDYYMLKKAGLACVPENAVSSVKEVADYIYPHVDIGGASEIITKIINDEV